MGQFNPLMVWIDPRDVRADVRAVTSLTVGLAISFFRTFTCCELSPLFWFRGVPSFYKGVCLGGQPGRNTRLGAYPDRPNRKGLKCHWEGHSGVGGPYAICAFREWHFNFFSRHCEKQTFSTDFYPAEGFRPNAVQGWLEFSQRRMDFAPIWSLANVAQRLDAKVNNVSFGVKAFSHTCHVLELTLTILALKIEFRDSKPVYTYIFNVPSIIFLEWPQTQIFFIIAV